MLLVALVLHIPLHSGFGTHPSLHHVGPSPLLQTRYCSGCLGISLFYAVSNVPQLRKSNARFVYALLKLIPLYLLLNCTSSSQISVTVFLSIVLLGFVSGKLKADNLYV